MAIINDRGGGKILKSNSKTVLMIVGIIVLLMGILGILPEDTLDIGTEPSWHAGLKILVGIVGIGVAYTDK